MGQKLQAGLLLLVLASSSGKHSDPQPRALLDDLKCTIQGEVTRVPTGEPVKGAVVSLYAGDSERSAYSVITDGSGRFRLKYIEPGKYKIWVRKTGYDSPQRKCDSEKIQDGDDVTLAPGQELSGIQLQLVAPAVITGTVFDPTGEPLPDAQVEAVRLYSYAGERTLSARGMAQTDDRGRFRIYHLTPGRYFVRIESAFLFEETIEETNEKTPAQSRGFLPIYYPGTTDLSQAVPIDVKPGEELDGVDLTVQAAHVFRIRGRVVNGITGEAMENGTVSLQARAPAMRENRGASHVADREGFYKIDNITPGQYVLLGQSTDSTTRTAWSGWQAVELTDSSLDDVRLKVFPGHNLSGHVQSTDGKRIDYSRLQIQLQPRESSGYWHSFAEAKRDGSFVLRDVGQGVYDVSIAGLLKGFYLKTIRLGTVNATGEGLTVGGDSAMPPVALVVSPAGASVDGTVQTAGSKTACEAMVVLVPEGSRRGVSRYYHFAEIDRFGRFAMSGIAPGDYKLFAWDDSENVEYLRADSLNPYENLGQSVHFDEDDHRAAVLRLILTEKQNP